MSYQYQPTGLLPILQYGAKGAKAVAKAAAEGSFTVGPLGLILGYYVPVKTTKGIDFLQSHLIDNNTAIVAQRAGILPITTVQIPATEKSPAYNLALFAKWADPILGRGSVSAGLFPWQKTDLFKEKKSEYKIPITSGEQLQFIGQHFQIMGKTKFVFGKGEGKQQVTARLSGDSFLLQRGPYSATKAWYEKDILFGKSLVDIAVISTLPVVAMNDEILKALDRYGIIDAFGEIIGAVLDVAAAVAGAAGFGGSPQQQYAARPNYLLWAGVAGGIILLAVIYKKRTE